MSPRKGPCQKKNLQTIIFEGTCQFSEEYGLHSHPFKGQRHSSWYDHYQHQFCKKSAWKGHHFCQDVPSNFPLPSAAFFPRAFLPHFSTWLWSHGNVFTLATEASRGWRLGGPTLNLEVLTSICLFPQRSLMFFVFACVDLWVFVEDNPSLVNYRKLITFRVFHFLLHSYLILCSLQLCLPSEFSYMYLIYNDPLWTTPKNPDFQVSVEVKKILSKSKFFKQSQSLIGGFNPLENIYARQIGSLLQGKGWNIGNICETAMFGTGAYRSITTFFWLQETCQVFSPPKKSYPLLEKNSPEAAQPM